MLHTLLLDENNIGPAGGVALGTCLSRCPVLRELGIARNPIGPGFAALAAGLGAAMVLLDASATGLDDTGAAVTAASLPRWPKLRTLKLGQNKDAGPIGAEAVARALLAAPELKMADLRGSSKAAQAEWPRLSKVLQDGGIEP